MPLEVQITQLLSPAESEIAVDKLQFFFIEIHSSLLEEDIEIFEEDGARMGRIEESEQTGV